MRREQEERILLFLKKEKQKRLYAIAVAAAFSAAQPALAQPVLKRVILSSGGVGLFGFDAPVSGAATLQLRVKLDQVDDILKSLDVQDPAGAMVSLRLAGRQPLAENFRALPFQPKDFASAEALLGALVGESVRIPLTGATGTILAVSPFQVPGAAGQGAVTRHHLTIATAQGVQSVVLEDTPDIAFSSDTLRAQIQSALAAIATQRVQDERTLAITLAGGGQRIVHFQYVVRAPVWKTSYRITLPPENTSGPAQLQAYAVLENLSGMNWNAVDMSLTSGRPALFHVPLYQALFLHRTEAPVDLPGTIAPPPDEEGASAALSNTQSRLLGERLQALVPYNSMKHPAAAAPAPLAGAIRAPSTLEAAAAQVDFHLSAPITAGPGQSLLVPVIDRTLPAQRIAYDPAYNTAPNPFVALEITNASDGALPPGVITLYQKQSGGEGYIGDARIATIEPQETRFASFAADLAVTVTRQSSTQTSLVAAKVSKGELSLTRDTFGTTAYTVITPKAAGRTVVIETPRIDNATVTEPASGVALTQNAVRVTQAVPAATTRVIRVTQKQEQTQAEALTPDTIDDFAYLASSGDVPKTLRDAMRHAADLRGVMAAQQATIENIKARRGDIGTDQQRIRQDLASVPPNSDLSRRYLATLSSQETELDSLDKQQSTAETALATAKKSLEDFLSSLVI